MPLGRRQFLSAAALLAASLGLPRREALAQGAAMPAPAGAIGEDWEAVRRQFVISEEEIDLSAMLLASHPAPVREAIERHRAGLDAQPVRYLERHYNRGRRAAMQAAGRYLGVDSSRIALTDSTTQAVGLVYNGLRLRPGQEILSTEQDYYVTAEAIRIAALRTGATVRRLSLFDDVAEATEDRIVERITGAIGPATRVLAVTWVHSSTGLKLPLARIAAALRSINAEREEADQVLLCVDAVHGFGNQDVTIEELGCDFFMAGCHKWLFGPRGTGIIAAGRRGWLGLLPSIPSFHDDAAWNAWQIGTRAPDGARSGANFTPGGFKAFEHQWALPEAFAFQTEIGKARVQARTEELAGRLKDGLAGMRNVRLQTPNDPALSAGIVSFDIAGYAPRTVVRRLRRAGIIGSVAPYAPPHARLTPSIRNSPAEIDRALDAIAGLSS